MPIENRTLEPGTVLTARYKRQDRTCAVVRTDDGVRFRLDTGRSTGARRRRGRRRWAASPSRCFPWCSRWRPSSAGKAAMGGIACNGWRFWSLAGTERPARAPRGEAKPKKAATTAPKGKAKKAPQGRGQRARAKEVPSYGLGWRVSCWCA